MICKRTGVLVLSEIYIVEGWMVLYLEMLPNPCQESHEASSLVLTTTVRLVSSSNVSKLGQARKNKTRKCIEHLVLEAGD